MLDRLRYWLAKRLLVTLEAKRGDEPRAILLARIDELALAITNLERERDYWSGRAEAALRRAEIAEDWVADLRRLADRELGRGKGLD
jgi:hypothetical protein